MERALELREIVSLREAIDLVRSYNENFAVFSEDGEGAIECFELEEVFEKETRKMDAREKLRSRLDGGDIEKWCVAITYVLRLRKYKNRQN